jgi:ankyrin repeat protein
MSSLRKTLAGCIASLLFLSSSAAIAGPLHDAARTGDPALIQVLFDAGADVNERDAAGQTPLMSAAHAANSRTLDRLLMLGADATARDNAGLLALHWAAFGGDPDSLALLFGGIKNHSGDMAAIDDAQNRFGVTPLMLAAELNHPRLVASLIFLGANLEVADANGHTALTAASDEGNEEIIYLLLRGGAACQTMKPIWFAECTERKSAMAR